MSTSPNTERAHNSRRLGEVYTSTPNNTRFRWLLRQSRPVASELTAVHESASGLEEGFRVSVSIRSGVQVSGFRFKPDQLTLSLETGANTGLPMISREVVNEREATRLKVYLQEAVRLGALTQGMADQSWALWKQLHSAMDGELEVPSAMPGPNNELMYTWRHGDHYGELEIFPDDRAEFFYKNRLTGELWDADYTVGNPVPDLVLGKLRLFTSA